MLETRSAENDRRIGKERKGSHLLPQYKLTVVIPNCTMVPTTPIAVMYRRFLKNLFFFRP